VVGYLVKPFTPEQILKNLDVFFEGEEAKEGMKILTYDQYFEKFKKYKRGGGR
jgi:response regulator of citrate/malate metabolism